MFGGALFEGGAAGAGGTWEELLYREGVLARGPVAEELVQAFRRDVAAAPLALPVVEAELEAREVVQES